MRRRIMVISLGGTIAMRSEGAGLAPSLGAEALLSPLHDAFPDLAISTLDLANTGSANISLSLLERLCEEVSRLETEGFDGVVVTQGTDTLEETAFAVELMRRSSLPITFTGAMRGASAFSPDGPNNLFCALSYLASPHAAAEVVVTLNDEVHAARHVRKAHTTSTAAFSSGEAGLRGRIHEGRFAPFHPPRPPLPVVGPLRLLEPPRVWIATIGVDQDETLFKHGADLGVHGWVVAGLGAGHVPERLAPALEALARAVPVVLCTRTGEGSVCEATYGYAGAEIDLLSRGLIPGGRLSPFKARVLLSLLLAEGSDTVRERFVDTARIIQTSP